MKEFLIGNANCYEFQATDQLVDSVLANIENSNVEYKKISLNQNNSPTMGYIKNEYGYTSFYHQELYSFLDECLKEVAEKNFNNFSLKIVDLWTTKSKFGQSSQSHFHTMSIFSGLLYLSDCDRSETEFTMNTRLYDNWKFFIHENFIKNKEQTYRVKPKKGKIIIWPSDIKHKITPHSTKDDRYTIAFNTFLEGISLKSSARINISLTDGCQPEDAIPFRKKT
jgi:uncharacterized protein (TIGR02466 family)